MAEPTQNGSNNEPPPNGNGHLDPMEILELNQERQQARLDNIYYLLRLQESARQQDFKRLHDMQLEQHRQMEEIKRSQHLLQLQVIQIQEIVTQLKQEREKQVQETKRLAAASSSYSAIAATPATAPAAAPPQEQPASQTEQPTTTGPSHPIFPVSLQDIVDEPRAGNAFKELQDEANKVIWKIIASYRAIRGGGAPAWADLPESLKKSAIGKMERIVDTWNAEWILKRQNEPEKWTQELPEGVEPDDSFMADIRENETNTSDVPEMDVPPPERHPLTTVPNTSDPYDVSLENPASPDSNHPPRTTVTTTVRSIQRRTYVEDVSEPEDISSAIVIPLESSLADTAHDATVISRNEEENNDNAAPHMSSAGSHPDDTTTTTSPGEGPSTSSTVMPTASTSAESLGTKRLLDEDDDDDGDDGHHDKRLHTEDRT